MLNRKLFPISTLCAVLICASISPAEQTSRLTPQSGGTEPTLLCVPEADRARLMSDMEAYAGKLGLATRVSAAAVFPDPVGSGGMHSFGQPINSLVDLNPSSGAIGDYTCGTATYDGHRGIDIEIRDFYAMDHGVAVLCVNSGVVVQALDGLFDRHVTSPPGTANHVGVTGFDGIFTLYWHMKNGSVRVSVGDTVQVGDTLGMVGSSGSSYWPHLHIESWTGGSFVDPMQGTCNASPIQFTTQPPYVYDLPFQVLTHGVTVLPPGTALIAERPPSSTHITLPANVTSWLRGRTIFAGDRFRWEFYRNGTLWDSLTTLVSVARRTGWFSVTAGLSNIAANIGDWEVQIYHNDSLVLADTFVANATPNQQPTVASESFAISVDSAVSGQLVSSDIDGAVFWHDVADSGSSGQFELTGPRRGEFRYVPDSGFIGIDTVAVYATDEQNLAGPPSLLIFDYLSSCCQVRGDFNEDGTLDPVDLSSMVDFFFSGGISPVCTSQSDANADGGTDPVDLSFLVDYFFSGGAAPPGC